MPIQRASGYVTYANTDYIVPVFSAKFLKKFYESTVLNEITTTEYLGEIKGKGDKVIVRTEPDVTIRDYVKGQDLILENPESPSIVLTIDYAKYFNFSMDDVDIKQFDVDLMSRLSANAAVRMKLKIESECLSALCLEALNQPIDSFNKGANAGKISTDINFGTTTTPLGLTKDNILDIFPLINQVLDEQNLPEEGRWIILPAWASTLIKLSEFKDASVSGLGKSTLLNGRLGVIDGITIYRSNLLPRGTNGSVTYTYIPFGTKEALAFATQLDKVETYRPEKTFADAIKGLQVYGFQVIYPQCLGKIIAYKA